MPKTSGSIVVDTGPEAIWALLCDPGVYPDLVEFTDRMVEVSEGEFGQGTTYREYGGIKPFKAESTWTVTEFVPMTRQVHHGTDPAMVLDLTIELEALDEGSTRFTQTVELTPKWFAKPLNMVMWPLMLRGRAQAAMDRTMENVKARAEAGGATPGGDRAGD